MLVLMFQQIFFMWDCSLVAFCCEEMQNALNHVGIHQGYENVHLGQEMKFTVVAVWVYHSAQEEVLCLFPYSSHALALLKTFTIWQRILPWAFVIVGFSCSVLQIHVLCRT